MTGRKLLGRLAATAIAALSVFVIHAQWLLTPPEPPVIVSMRPTAVLGPLTVYLTEGGNRAMAILLSGPEGWTEQDETLARTIASRGIIVIGLVTPALVEALDRAPGRCLDPSVPLIRYVQGLQRGLGLARYDHPLLVGRSSGAMLAYATMAQAPAGLFRGAVGIMPRPSLRGAKPWCATPGFASVRAGEHGEWRFMLDRPIGSPWIEVSAEPPPGNNAALDAINQLIGLPPSPANSRLAATADLPLNIVFDPNAVRTDLMAVLYSGDGGWAGLDRDLAAQLAEAGVPVVGVDSLQYFWSARTPEGAGADLSRIVSAYSAAWERPRILLLGYSFGADNLPFIIAHLDAPMRSRIARASLLGLSPSAEFQFHVGSWLGIASTEAMPTVPAVTRLRGLALQCIRGTLETASACPDIPAGIVQEVVVPGGHHFEGNAARLARAVLAGIVNHEAQ